LLAAEHDIGVDKEGMINMELIFGTVKVEGHGEARIFEAEILLVEGFVNDNLDVCKLEVLRQVVTRNY
jgi:hypothetical protein